MASPVGGSPAAAANALNFNNIRLNGSTEPGQFRVMNDKFGWRVKRAVTKRTVQFDAQQVRLAEWVQSGPAGREFTLRIVLFDESAWRFDNFRENDHGPLEKHITQNWKGLSLKSRSADWSGRSWGFGALKKARFQFLPFSKDAPPGGFPEGDSNGETALPIFEFCASRCVSKALASKDDVVITFKTEDSHLSTEDLPMEMRLYIPPLMKATSAVVSEEGGGGVTAEAAAPTIDFAEELKNALLREGGVSTADARAVCVFHDVKVVIPAGRFDLCLQRGSLQLKGRSSDFIIDANEVLGLYYLKNPTMPLTSIVLALKNPLRKGRTVYQHAILQFDDKKVLDVDVDMTPEQMDMANERLREGGLKIEPVMKGPMCDLAKRLLTLLLGKAALEPSTSFKSASGQPCVRCSFKAESGCIYLLDKAFIYITKPVIIVPYEEIATVALGRTSGSQTKLFEFDVTTKAGQTYSFSSVDRQEAAPLTDFLQNQQIKVRTFARDDRDGKEGNSILERDLPSDDDEDEDFQAETSEDDEGSLEEDDETEL